MAKKALQCEINKTYAHLMEVIIESSFQPLFQWYIVFPGIYALHQNGNELRSFCNETSFKNLLEFSSWLLSLFSLAWSFTAYNAAMKNGALSLDVNPVGRGLVFLSNLCLIFVRMNFIIFFMYSYGPGQFYPGVVAILVHVLLMGSLHISFVDHDTIPFASNLKSLKRLRLFLIFGLSFLVNGLANIYCHNYVDTEREHTSFWKKIPSVVRQSVFDMVFLLENIAIAILASQDNQIPVKPFDDINADLSCLHGFSLFTSQALL